MADIYYYDDDEFSLNEDERKAFSEEKRSQYSCLRCRSGIDNKNARYCDKCVEYLDREYYG